MTATQSIVRAAGLDQVAAFGPWFAVSPGRYGTPGWEPAASVCRDGARLDQLIRDCAARYDTGNRLIGVSFLLKSYTARIAFPAIACSVTQRQVPDVSAGNVALRFFRGRATGVTLRTPSLPMERAERMSALHATLVDGHLRRVVTALQERSTAQSGWLWGIVADACASAFVHLPPHAADRNQLRRDAEAFLAVPGSPLAGRGHVTERDGRLFFERGSCCLYFLAPRGTYCDNCSVQPGRRRALKEG